MQFTRCSHWIWHQLPKNQAFCNWPPSIPLKITIVTASEEAALAKLWLMSVSITSAAPLLLCYSPSSSCWRTSKRRSTGREGCAKCGFFLQLHLTSTEKLLRKITTEEGRKLPSLWCSRLCYNKLLQKNIKFLMKLHKLLHILNGFF